MLVNEPLARHTTLELGGPASFFMSVGMTGEEDVPRAIAFAREQGLPWWVLGDGSNVLVPDAGLRGTVIQMRLYGVELERFGSEYATWHVCAGEPWDKLVEHAASEDYCGIECLAGIPGRVGATPIQNVGAYGQEVAQTIVGVRVYDVDANEFKDMQPDECGFAYRDSVFRRNPARFVITRVSFRLRRGLPAKPTYAELAKAIGEDEASAMGVRDTVLELRAAKSMVLDANDPNRRSVGSFFKNPIVSADVAANVAGAPRWVQLDGRVKLAAGWLIEQAGVTKGMRRGHVGVSSKHALALVHHGGGTTSELLSLADEIAHKVQERFGVTLEREPVALGT